MLNQTAVFALISQLGGSNNNIIFNAHFVDFCGGCHNSAMLLAQLLYWSDKTRLEGGWIAKTKEDWYKELRLSPYQTRKAEEKMGVNGMGFLEIVVAKFNGFPTNHYRLNQQAFTHAFVKFLNEGYSTNLTNPVSKETKASIVKKVEQPYTETTKTDTTTEPYNSFGGGASGPRRGSKKIMFEEMEPGISQEPTQARAKKGGDTCPVFKPAQISFEAEYLSRNGTPYRFNGGKDGAALKSILLHLKEKVAPGKDWATALDLFNAIIQGWGNLPKWYHQKFNLAIINSQLNEILAGISATIRGVNNSNISAADFE